MDIRKAHSEKPWPPSDRDVGVILVAHSMGFAAIVSWRLDYMISKVVSCAR